MPAAVDLADAAYKAAANLAAKWLAAGLFSAVFNFNNAVKLIFPDDGSYNERTVSNWLVIGVAAQASPPNKPFYAPANQSFDIIYLSQLTEYVYRLCWAGFAARAASPGRISAAQATALLAAYNTHLA